MIPVAILGTEDLDVTMIDPTASMLEGVPPIRWAYEDTSAPYLPFIGKYDCNDCIETGPDGYMDLVLFYRAQEINSVIDYAADGDCLNLWMDTKLKQEYGGTVMVGQDVLKIIRK